MGAGDTFPLAPGLALGNSAAFIPFVFLHAISALIGFGSVGFAGTYASRVAHMAASGELMTGGLYGRALARSSPAQLGGSPVSTYPAGPAEAIPAQLTTSQPRPGLRGRTPASPAEPAGGVALPAPPATSPGATSTAATSPGATSPGASLAERAPTEPGQLDPEVEELVRYFQRPARFWKSVLAVPVFGVLAVEFQPNGKGLDQVWTVTALFVWLVATVLVVGVVVPGLKQVNQMLPEAVGPLSEVTGGSPGGAITPVAGGPAGVAVAREALKARIRRAGSLAGRGAAACDLLFFIGLALMIWRP